MPGGAGVLQALLVNLPAGRVEVGFRTRVGMWKFPKSRGACFCGPYDKDPTIWGYYIRVPLCSETPISSGCLCPICKTVCVHSPSASMTGLRS